MRWIPPLIGLALAGLTLGACSSSGSSAPATRPHVKASRHVATTTTTQPPAPTSTVPPTTQPPAPTSTVPPTTTTVPSGVPSGGVDASALDNIVGYIMAGYCTPNGVINQCEEGESSDASVAAPLAEGAYKSLGYDLCSAAQTNEQDYCGGNDSEGILDALAFSSPAAAHAYIVSKNGQSWVMGWQLNQWAILIKSTGMPLADQDNIQKSLASAAAIYNGQPLDDGQGAPASLSQVF